MSKPTRQRRAPDARPGEILEAALALFVEKGFAATRLEDVAARAGLSKAALYLYFDDKQTLFEAVVRQRLTGNFDALSAMVAAHRGPIGPLIGQIFAFIGGRIVDTPIAGIVKLVIGESRAFPEIGRFYLREVIGRGLPLMEQLVVRGIASGEFRRVDPAFAVRSMIGPMMLAMVWRSVLEPIGAAKLDVAAFSAHHADFVVHALKAGEPRP
ncbi:MAG: TetR/AcrR family transcriptional regulator [Alphaproteobacteria bacterium]|nr:TetR/AcrR family transcriptional regulator [Alphaproteobacteria bacterium]